jgi:hypothetical protein
VSRYYLDGPADSDDLSDYLPQTWRELRAWFIDFISEQPYALTPKSPYPPRPSDWRARFADWCDRRAEVERESALTDAAMRLGEARYESRADHRAYYGD